MRSIIILYILFLSFELNAQVGTKNEAFGIQVGGSLLLYNNCCGSVIKNSLPELDLGYRIALLSRHMSGYRFYHDFQLSYSRERIGYTQNRNMLINEEYVDYEAYHLTYYFGLKPVSSVPIKVFVGHNFGHIVHNHGSNVESELFGLNFKMEATINIDKLYYIEPIVDFSWTYNKDTSYNRRLVFGVNIMRRI